MVSGREQTLLSWPYRVIVKVGQQALATFLTSMALAWILTIVLDQTDRDPLTVAVVNLFGLATIVAVAYIVGWYKQEPWRRPRPAPEQRATGPVGALSRAQT